MPDEPTYRVHMTDGQPEYICLVLHDGIPCDYLTGSLTAFQVHMSFTHAGVMIREDPLRGTKEKE